MGFLLQDLRFALRQMRRRPAFSAVAVLALGIGIGATTAMFSVVDGVLMRPLPYTEPGQLVAIWQTFPHWRGRPTMEATWDQMGLSYPDYADLREQQTFFSDVAAYNVRPFVLNGLGEPREVAVGIGTASLLPLLGITPSVGRWFLPGEEGGGAPLLAVLSHEIWESGFGADANVIGRTLALDDDRYTIVGVLPPGFQLERLRYSQTSGGRPAVWIPVGADGRRLHPESLNFEAIGRLQPGRPLADAQLEAERIFQADGDPTKRGARLELRREAEIGAARVPLLLLFGAVCLLLLIACGNVGALLLGEVGWREGEIATRSALGASRVRIVRQLLTESALLASCGALVGCLLAAWGTRVLVVLSPVDISRLDQVGFDWRVLAFALAVAIATTLIFGLAPALSLARSDNYGSIANSRRVSRHRSRLQNTAMIGQLALSMVLMVSAGLLFRSLVRQRSVDPGFRSESLLTFRLSLPGYRYTSAEQREMFAGELQTRLAALPGVAAVTSSTALPFTSYSNRGSISVSSEDLESRLTSSSPIARYRVVDPGYFETLDIPLLAGRLLSHADRADAPRVIVVNESMARRFWPSESPLGKGLLTPYGLMTVVGVVGDFAETGQEDAMEPALFHSRLQRPPGALAVAVRTRIEPRLVAEPAMRAVWELDSALPISEVASMEELLSRSLADERYRSLMVMLFAVIAVVLVAVGISGVAARTVSQRTRELGIRIALGSTAARASSSILIQAAPGIFAGVAGGIAVALPCAGLLDRYLFEVGATDLLTYAAAAGLLFGVSSLAVYLPARRIARLDAAEVLRAD